MATLSLIQYLTFTLNGVTYTMGSQTEADSVTVASTSGIKTFNVASGATQTLFDRGAAGELSLTDLWAVLPAASSTFLLEVASDATGTVVYLVVPLVADRLWVWHDGGMHYGSAAGSFAGTLGEIDTIKAKNTGVSAANITFLGTKAT